MAETKACIGVDVEFSLTEVQQLSTRQRLAKSIFKRLAERGELHSCEADLYRLSTKELTEFLKHEPFSSKAETIAKLRAELDEAQKHFTATFNAHSKLLIEIRRILALALGCDAPTLGTAENAARRAASEIDQLRNQLGNEIAARGQVQKAADSMAALHHEESTRISETLIESLGRDFDGSMENLVDLVASEFIQVRNQLATAEREVERLAKHVEQADEASPLPRKPLEWWSYANFLRTPDSVYILQDLGNGEFKATYRDWEDPLLERGSLPDGARVCEEHAYRNAEHVTADTAPTATS